MKKKKNNNEKIRQRVGDDYRFCDNRITEEPRTLTIFFFFFVSTFFCTVYIPCFFVVFLSFFFCSSDFCFVRPSSNRIFFFFPPFPSRPLHPGHARKRRTPAQHPFPASARSIEGFPLFSSPLLPPAPHPFSLASLARRYRFSLALFFIISFNPHRR